MQQGLHDGWLPFGWVWRPLMRRRSYAAVGSRPGKCHIPHSTGSRLTDIPFFLYALSVDT